MTIPITRTALAILAGAALALTACSNNGEEPEESTGAAGATPTTGAEEDGNDLDGDLTEPFTFVSGTPGWHHSMAFIADELDIWAELGVTDVDFVPMNTGTTAGEAIGSGNADAGYTNTATAIALVAAGAEVTIISGTSQGGNGVIVTEDSELQSPADLEGRDVAVPQGNTAHELMFRLHVLPEVGLSYDDINRVPLEPQDMAVALLRGDVDAAVTYDPFMGAAIGQGARFLVEPADMWDGAAYSSTLLVSNDLIENNPALVQAIADMHAAAISTLQDDPETVSEILADVSGQDVEETRTTWETIEFLAEADVDSFQQFVDGMADLGLIDEAPDLATGLDASYIERSTAQ